MKREFPPPPPEVLAALGTVAAWFASLATPAAPPVDDFVDATTSVIGAKVFRGAARAGEFPVFKVGKKWLAKRSDVAAYVERQRVTFGPKKAAEPANDDERDFSRALRAVKGGRS